MQNVSKVLIRQRNGHLSVYIIVSVHINIIVIVHYNIQVMYKYLKKV